MLRESTGDKEDVDVRAERLRVDEATITSRAGTETTAAPDTVLIRGLTKVLHFVPARLLYPLRCCWVTISPEFR